MSNKPYDIKVKDMIIENAKQGFNMTKEQAFECNPCGGFIGNCHLMTEKEQEIFVELMEKHEIYYYLYHMLRCRKFMPQGLIDRLEAMEVLGKMRGELD